MIDREFLELLRCPVDPRRQATLTQGEEGPLRCSRCDLRFPTKDGFPVLVAGEAQLPPGCATWDELPCQRKG